MASAITLKKYIDRCDQVISQASESEAKSLVEEILCVFQNEYAGLSKGLKTYTSPFGDCYADYIYSLRMLRGRLQVELEKDNNITLNETSGGTSAKLDNAFIAHASEVLADTKKGLTGGQIIKYCNSYAVDFDVNIPVTSSDFGTFGSVIPNKRTALQRNLLAFNATQQFAIIKELCELPVFEGNNDATDLKRKLIERYSQYASGNTFIDDYAPTGWDRVDRAISEMKERLQLADTEEKFQAIGMLGRETLISIAQQVFDPVRHPTLDGVEASKTDAKRMLEAFFEAEMVNNTEKTRKFAKAAVDLANQLTHDRNATKAEADMCLVSVVSVGELAKIVARKPSE